MSNRKKIILIICITGILLRLLYLFFHPGNKYFLNRIYIADGIDDYDPLARNLLAGKGFVDTSGNPSVGITPGYPFFLAMLYFFFNYNVVAVRIVQIFLNILSCYFIYLIAREIFDEKVGLLSFLIGVLYYPFIQIPCFIFADTLFILFFLISIYFSLKFLRVKNKIENVILAGVFAALTTLTKPAGVVLFIGFPLALFFYSHKKEFLKYLVLFSVSVFTIMTPWIIRNYKVYGKFILISPGDGFVLYSTNNPSVTGGTGGWFRRGIDTKVEYPPEIKNMSLLEADRYLRKKAILYIKTHKRHFLYLCCKKFLNMWRPFYAGSNIVNRIIMILWDLLVLYPLSILGFILFYRKEKSSRIILFYLLVVMVLYTLLFMISFSVIRYRYPIMCILIIFASYAFSKLKRPILFVHQI